MILGGFIKLQFVVCLSVYLFIYLSVYCLRTIYFSLYTSTYINTWIHSVRVVSVCLSCSDEGLTLEMPAVT